ncbi:MAG: hypothetical protein PHI40_01710 [Caldisericia bacterium]|nr:hypothetical protein [Caldisericia bacterium]
MKRSYIDQKNRLAENIFLHSPSIVSQEIEKKSSSYHFLTSSNTHKIGVRWYNIENLSILYQFPIFGISFCFDHVDPFDESLYPFYQDAIAYIQTLAKNQKGYYILRVPKEFPFIKSALIEKGPEYTYMDSTICYGIIPQASHLPQKNVSKNNSTPSTKTMLRKITEESFQNYESHYSLSPLLRPLSAEVYIEWIDTLSRADNSAIYTHMDSSTVTGFIATVDSLSSTDIVLNAVSPHFRQRGIYEVLCKHVLHDSFQKSVSVVTVSTQIHNLSVQKVWQKLHFQPFHVFDLYHFHNLS